MGTVPVAPRPVAAPGVGRGGGAIDAPRPGRPGPRVDGGWRAPVAWPAVAVGAWVLLVVVAVAWGAAIAGPEIKLRAAPLMGRWDLRLGPGLLPALAVGAAVTAWGPQVAARVRWRALLALAWATAVVWTVALAAADGWDRVTEPLTSRHEYEPLAATIHDLGGFLGSYVEDLPSRPIHVQGHPPGPVVVAWLADAVGLGGAGWLAAITIGAWGGAAVAALVAARTVAGQAAARRAAPALVVLPAAVWAGTSVDALFAGLVALAVALAAIAAARASAVHAVMAGLVFGAALLSSYGAAPFVLVVAAAVAAGAAATMTRTPSSPPTAATGGSRDVMDVAAAPGSVEGGGGAGVTTLAGMDVAPVVGRTVATGAVVGATALGLLVLAAGAGFWWLDGLHATREAYWSGAAAVRPGLWLTLVGNPAALALAVGPAVAAGFALLGARHARLSPSGRSASGWGASAWGPRAWVLPVAALVAVAAVDLSQLSRGEVERIWLPFVPWLALAAPGDRRGWLGAQVVLALSLQAALRSPW